MVHLLSSTKPGMRLGTATHIFSSTVISMYLLLVTINAEHPALEVDLIGNCE